ncbi:hypothetical protein C8P63_1473 [Melghirimyces profundicolus]|uniref:Uncharacterized protein n=1 Tax=Melghirimyces profundicolus TaxID=1242148 RepID=A0A2T6AWD3_9BACL|nr:hypothetical protein C8P63_1473 [Melghirimyces profundicolus]
MFHLIYFLVTGCIFNIGKAFRLNIKGYDLLSNGIPKNSTFYRWSGEESFSMIKMPNAL